MVTVQEAHRILGVPLGTEKKEIKKKYRKLMMQVHPDVGISSQESYGYSAQEINSAYAVLMKENLVGEDEASCDPKSQTVKRKKHEVWDVPVNENAFVEREVLQYVENHDGTVLGNYCVAKGKYLWKTEEDFPLFLLSIYQCSKKLLDGIGKKVKSEENLSKQKQIQAELAYLLAQQFIDGSALLTELAKEEKTSPDGGKIFYLSAMLELTNFMVSVKAGEMIYPSGIRKHKLYLKNQSGQELGYLSFHDDRLYYIVIPLFEQRRVQVKLQAAEGKSEKRRKPAKYQNLHLWIRLSKEDTNRMPESINLQIKKLLENWS